MKSENIIIDNNKMIYTGENDEEVLNCEGGPCNFVYNDRRIQNSSIIMTQLKQVYKCEVCGNMVEIIHASNGTLVCCGQPMTLQVENTVDAVKEKHVPVVS